MFCAAGSDIGVNTLVDLAADEVVDELVDEAIDEVVDVAADAVVDAVSPVFVSVDADKAVDAEVSAALLTDDVATPASAVSVLPEALVALAGIGVNARTKLADRMMRKILFFMIAPIPHPRRSGRVGGVSSLLRLSFYTIYPICKKKALRYLNVCDG